MKLLSGFGIGRDRPGGEDIVLGTPVSPCRHPEYRLTPQQQRFHSLCLGSTGTGKSKLLQSMFLQHVLKGHGIGLIDPHGDLAVDCLSSLAQRGFFSDPSAYDRLVYVEFSDTAFVPFNVLQQPHSRAEDIANNVREALCRVWPELAGAVLFETLFPAGVLTLIQNDLTLTHLPRLLLDDEFRKGCLSSVTNQSVHEAFGLYVPKGSSIATQGASTLRRLFQLSFSPATFYSLGQPENLLNFRELMDRGASLIVNLGGIQNDVTRRLLASLCLTTIEQAAMSRVGLPASARRPWTCLVDEWFSIAPSQGTTLENILSQTRKYGLSLILVGQHKDQAASASLVGALENCRLMILFRVGPATAKVMVNYLATGNGSGMVIETEDLVNLPPQHAVVKADNEPPVLIRTLRIDEPDQAGIWNTVEAVRGEYRRRYQRSKAEVTSSAESVSGGRDPVEELRSLREFVDDDEPIFGDRR